MVSNISSTPPTSHADGTLSALVQDIQPLATGGNLLHVRLPIAYDVGGGFGSYFLARCVDDTAVARAEEWSIYARRPLFCAALPTAAPEQSGSLWELSLPPADDPGLRWLAQRPFGSSINLIGPLGRPFAPAAHTRALLVIATPVTLPVALPAIHSMLDQGGRVTLVVKGEAQSASPLLPRIPIAVEVRWLPADTWLSHLAEPLRWADQLCAALPNADYAPLAFQIRSARFHVDADFAHVLVNSDLICGTGACLACVVSTRDGSFTRTCIHGPVLPLATLV